MIDVNPGNCFCYVMCYTLDSFASDKATVEGSSLLNSLLAFAISMVLTVVCVNNDSAISEAKEGTSEFFTELAS